MHGVEALRALRAVSPVALAMDETAAEPGAPGSGATDAVCLKISRCGGITGVLRDARAARAAGSARLPRVDVRRPARRRRGVHAAAALAAGGEALPACGLATLAAFRDHADVLRPAGGAIAVPAGPGLLG